MRIIGSREGLINALIKSIDNRDKEDVINRIAFLQRAIPKLSFFNYCSKEFGGHLSLLLKKKLLENKLIYQNHPLVKDVYKEIGLQTISSVVPDMVRESKEFDKRIASLNLPLEYTTYFRINTTYEPEPYIVLASIVVNKDSRKDGVGSQFMEELIKTADKLGSLLLLTTSSDFGSNVEKLRKFYSKFGFKRNLGRAKDYRFMESMIRLPNKKDNK